MGENPSNKNSWLCEAFSEENEQAVLNHVPKVVFATENLHWWAKSYLAAIFHLS